jgi:hypothetical protein
MATVFLKMALAAVIAVASAVALVGVSGMIVFADLSAPKPSELAADAFKAAPAVSGVNK